MSEERATIERWKRDGHLQEIQMAELADPNWRAFLRMRAASKEDIEARLKQLPLSDYFDFTITQLSKGESRVD
ncbi:MAG: muconolactone Delta-isomerase family protein [Planctomycetota bacterium]